MISNAVSTMYAGRQTSAGQSVPIVQQGPNAGSVNINAILQSMVSRDIWTYYYTLKLAAGTTFAPQYYLFNAPSGSSDPYPLSGTPVLTHVETNMPSSASQGFSAPRDLILNRMGFYFLPAGCGASNSGVGTVAALADMYAFCQYSYFEFKILEKIFVEGYLELQPAGVGFSGFSTTSNQNIVTLGMANPHATNKMGDFAKYLAPQMTWSLTIYFPSSSGPAGASAVMLSQGAGGNGLWLKTNFTGLTDRAVQ